MIAAVERECQPGELCPKLCGGHARVYSSRPTDDGRRAQYFRCNRCRETMGVRYVPEDRPEPRQFLEIDPHAASQATPGSEEKVATMAARYEAGLPLWNDEDRLEHGPSDDDPPVAVQLEDEDDGCELD